MNKTEFKSLIEQISAAYSNLFVVTPDVLNVWFENLSDLDFKAVEGALKAFIRQNHYPPTISDLRRFNEKLEGVRKENIKELKRVWENICNQYPASLRDEKAKTYFLGYIKTVASEKRVEAAKDISNAVRAYVRKKERGTDTRMLVLSDCLKKIIQLKKRDEKT